MMTLLQSPSPGQALGQGPGKHPGSMFTGSCAFVKCGRGCSFDTNSYWLCFPLKYFSWWLVNWEWLMGTWGSRLRGSWFEIYLVRVRGIYLCGSKVTRLCYPSNVKGSREIPVATVTGSFRAEVLLTLCLMAPGHWSMCLMEKKQDLKHRRLRGSVWKTLPDITDTKETVYSFPTDDHLKNSLCIK